MPHYSTRCRRQRALRIPVSLSTDGQPRYIVIDATGLPVYGAGEWYVRKHRGDWEQDRALVQTVSKNVATSSWVGGLIPRRLLTLGKNFPGGGWPGVAAVADHCPWKASVAFEMPLEIWFF